MLTLRFRNVGISLSLDNIPTLNICCRENADGESELSNA